MRITKIKLAGFKSFVDPTTLALPGNLTGIVGPNGCGKSNIIDAMMWVMGESSAKHLRGDSMADVIFSGSNSRKPVGQASVEIIFDNSDGTIAGQYAGFSEISIKRTISRDGVSNYELNGTRCRRKDITNVFLGTGLGARGGYSVIEQGMISRVVEAKPEELRGFLEEAAGISKYKERRRETENRIKHTKENLARLEDIREELDKQLAHLQRQARAAERYQVLKQEERQGEAQAMAVKWRDIDLSRSEHAKEVERFQTGVEEALAELRGIEKSQTEKREAHTEATDRFNKVQSDFYAKTADISRLENAIQSHEERVESLRREQERSRTALSDLMSILGSDEAKIKELEQAVISIEPDFRVHDDAEKQAAAALKSAEDALTAWQKSWEICSTRRAEYGQEERTLQVRLEHLSAGLSDAQIKAVALEDERATSRTLEVDEKIGRLSESLAVAQKRLDEILVDRGQRRERLQEERHRLQQKNQELHTTRVELEACLGRQASMRALQEAALGADEEEFSHWLKQTHLANAPRLAESIKIERGWELAVETALRIPLDAFCEKSPQVIDELQSLEVPRNRLCVITDGDLETARGKVNLQALTEKIDSRWDLNGALAGVYVAEDEATARKHVGELKAYESIVTRTGFWIGPNWVQLSGAAAEQDSVLQRERALEDLADKIERTEKQLAEQQQAVDDANLAISAEEQALAALETQLSERNDEATALKTDLARTETTREQIVEREQNIAVEINNLEKRSQADQEQIESIKVELGGLQTSLEKLTAEHRGLDSNRHDLQQKLDKTRHEWREARETKHQLALRLENHKTAVESLRGQLERNLSQKAALENRAEELRLALSSQDTPQHDLKAQLDGALKEKLELETSLANARKELAALEEGNRSDDEARLLAEQKVDERKQVLEQARLEERTIEVRLQELNERIGQTDFALEDLLAELPKELTEHAANEGLEKIRVKINRLGAINLAAIDEFAQLSERKEYLDKQHEDLINALETLEGAIRKIDKETRTRFRETFDKVNSGFQNLFPTLFGGGHAYLELSGEDLLDTGVSVMARPPGKRNSTIHLLSGGEKALTALAFVFSLFELNPAPFCLLDEVDAPLDDANVVRLSDMLKTMAKQVQFLYISHNKITMEIAEQLIGVTMQEPGVSRLVSVNMEEAVEMAQAS